jgi:hypothetical protein
MKTPHFLSVGFFGLFSTSTSLPYILLAEHIASLKQLLIILLSSLWIFGLQAQNTQNSSIDSLAKIDSYHWFQKDAYWKDSIQSTKIDTTFSPFFYYSPQFHNFKMNLGNNGTAQRNLYYEVDNTIGFKTQFDQLHDFKFTANNAPYLELSQPYTRVFYINGAQKEEGINVAFSQNIRKNWNTLVEYKKIGSIGFYQKQRTALNRFRITHNFKSKNNRYALIAYVNYNDNTNEENGGIVSDSIFENSPEFTRQGIEVRLTEAKNYGRNQEYFIQQQLNFGPIKKSYYSSPNDSSKTDSVIAETVQSVVSPFHSIRYYQSEYIYDDYATDPNNYPFGTVISNGSLSVRSSFRQVDNTIGISAFPFKAIQALSDLNVKAFGRYQYLEYEQFNHFADQQLNENYLNNTIIGASVENSNYKKLHYGLTYESVIDGYDKNDVSLHARLGYNLKWIKIDAGAKQTSLNPKILFRQYKGVAYTWQNNLDLENTLNVYGKISLPKLGFRLETQTHTIDNKVYFNSLSEVVQHKGTISIWQTELSQHFKLWYFHLDATIRYQLTDQIGIINIPEWLGYGKFYFESTLFKKDMLYRIGLDLFISDAYNADNYNPVIRSFTSQTNQEVESFPWGDFYLMAKVDRTYFFARLSNVFEGAIPYNYYSSPGYPLPDRALKLGVKWEFVN